MIFNNTNCHNQYALNLKNKDLNCPFGPGGPNRFKTYANGVVNLALQGSCNGCPGSMITLKAGIEGKMKRMIPEVQEVVADAE